MIINRDDDADDVRLFSRVVTMMMSTPTTAAAARLTQAKMMMKLCFYRLLDDEDVMADYERVSTIMMATLIIMFSVCR